MCTVSYAPIQGGGHVVTSNRDERTVRAGAPASQWRSNGVELLAPKDALTGTSWIATSALGRTVCLLNGSEGTMRFADEPSRSRGTVLLEVATTTHLQHQLRTIDLFGAHPFTLICAEQDSLRMLQWNGHTRSLSELDHTRSHVWSSTTLYDRNVREQRAYHFNDMLSRVVHPNPGDLWNFHARPHLDDERQAVIMERGNDLRTVSITQAILNPFTNAVMRHLDLLRAQEHNVELLLLNQLIDA
ncbi:MAG: NRDE family protein [Flavobacteriales bacterium]|nr:NRDE family protein [Flavobacteriales bacterium]